MAILLSASCATIFTGTKDSITFTSNVGHVRVFMGGRLLGETPLTVDVKRQVGQGPLVRFVKKGYRTQEFHLEHEFNMVSILDISSIVTSGGIDVLSGAIMKYSPDHYHVEMLANNQTSLEELQNQIEFAEIVLLNADWVRADLANGGGEYYRAIMSLATTRGSTPSEFKRWVQKNKVLLTEARGPEMLLAMLRKSRLTP